MDYNTCTTGNDFSSHKVFLSWFVKLNTFQPLLVYFLRHTLVWNNSRKQNMHTFKRHEQYNKGFSLLIQTTCICFEIHSEYKAFLRCKGMLSACHSEKNKNKYSIIFALVLVDPGWFKSTMLLYLIIILAINIVFHTDTL